MTMIEKNLQISLAEYALKGKMIISQQPEITYAQALQQIQKLQKISKSNPLLKKHRQHI